LTFDVKKQEHFFLTLIPKQPTANSQQPTANSQQPTANSLKPTA